MIALTIPIKCKTIVHSGPSRQRGEHPSTRATLRLRLCTAPTPLWPLCGSMSKERKNVFGITICGGITHAAGDKTCTCIFRNYCPSFAHVRRGLQKHFRHERQCKHGRYGHHALSGGHPGHAGQLLEHAHQPFGNAVGTGREPRERVRQTPRSKKRATRFWTPWTHSLRRTQPEPERCWTKSTPPPPGWARCAKS